jgi:hypothetical protein
VAVAKELRQRDLIEDCDITTTPLPSRHGPSRFRLSLRRVAAVIVELRQYTLHPSSRDTLIDLFEREFLESQEACGMTLIGQFRDLDDPDRFVWFRAFSDMEQRKAALACFYGGTDLARPSRGRKRDDDRLG